MNFIKKYSFMMLLLSGAMTIVSCSNDTEEFNAGEQKRISFVAGSPALEGTRVELGEVNGELTPLWSRFQPLRLFTDNLPKEGIALQSLNLQPVEETSFFIIDDVSTRAFEQAMKNEATKYFFLTNNNTANYSMMNKELYFVNGFGTHGDLNEQLPHFNNIDPNTDLLVSQRVDKNDADVIDPTNPKYDLRFKRYTGIMKIVIDDQTTGKRIMNGDWKAKSGWISAGDAVKFDNGKLTLDKNNNTYNTNNFAGEAFVGMGDNNLYKLRKGKGSGIKLSADLDKTGKDYFYDSSNPTPIYISALPTALRAGETIQFCLGEKSEGDTTGRHIIKDLTVGQDGFEIEACHIHTITVKITDADLKNWN